MRETWVRSLGQEDPLEEGMATHSSILAWRIPWTEDFGGLYSPRVAKSWTWLSNSTKVLGLTLIPIHHFKAALSSRIFHYDGIYFYSNRTFMSTLSNLCVWLMATILNSAVPEKHLWQNSLMTFSPSTWAGNFRLHLTRILCKIWLCWPFHPWKSLFGFLWHHGFMTLPTFIFSFSSWGPPFLPASNIRIF